MMRVMTLLPLVCILVGAGCSHQKCCLEVQERVAVTEAEQLRRLDRMDDRIARLEESTNDRLRSLESRLEKLDDLFRQMSERTIQAATLGIAVPRDVSEHLNKARCHANQRALEAAVAVFMADHRGQRPDSLGDLLTAKLVRVVPTCPADSSAYEYDREGATVRCRHHPRW